MEIIVISLVLVLGALFVIPRSNGREILGLYKGGGINPQHKEGLLDLWIIINDKVVKKGLPVYQTAFISHYSEV